MNDLRKTNSLLTVLVVLGVGVLLINLRGILLPLFVAMFLSYLAMPLVRLGKRCRIPVALSLVVVLVLIAGGIGGLGRVIFTSGSQLVEGLPDYEARLRPLLVQGMELARVPEELMPQEGETIDWKALLQSDLARGYARAGASSVLGWAGNLGLIFIFLVFIVLDRGRESLDSRIVRAFSSDGRSAGPIVAKIHQQIENYILTKTGISLVTGILVSSTLGLFGVPFALLFGVVAFLLNFIPNIGSIVATIPPILIALVDGSPVRALAVAAVLTTIQVLIGNIIEPMIMGQRLQLSPITVLVFLALWGWLWGIWGMVLAVPLAATLRIILDEMPSMRSIGTLMSEG